MPSTCAPPSAYPRPGVPSGGGPSLGAPWSGVQPACVSSAAASPDPKHPAAPMVPSAVTDANSLRIPTPACSATRLYFNRTLLRLPGVQPNELVLPILLGAGAPPDLAARRDGNRPWRHQNEVPDVQAVRIGYRGGDIALDLMQPACRRISPLLDLDDGHQLLGTVHRNRNRRDTTAGDFLDRCLDVLGKMIAATNDEHVLDTADDEQPAIGREAQITGSEPGSVSGARRRVIERCTEALLLPGWPAPVAFRDIVAMHPDLADHIVRALAV